MDVVVLIGRILYAFLFLSAGVGGHLMQTDAMSGYAQSMGVEPARPLVLITGVQLVAGGLMVLLGVWADLGALLLVAFLLVTAVLMHPFWRIEGEQQTMEQTQFSKDVALAGAGLALFALFVLVPDLGYTLTGPLFG